MTSPSPPPWEEHFPAADWTGALHGLQSSWAPVSLADAVLCAVLWGAAEDDLALRVTIWEAPSFEVEPPDPVAAARKALHELVDRGHVIVWLPTYSYDWKSYDAADAGRAHELIEEPVWWIPYDDIPDELLREAESRVDENGKTWAVAGQVEEVRVSATDIGKAWVQRYGYFGSGIMRISRPEPLPELVDGRLPWRDGKA